MQPGQATNRAGVLKVLAGPVSLVRLIRLGAETCSVTVGDGALAWQRNASAPRGTIRGGQIQSVQQSGAAFVVNLDSGATGIGALTFEAASASEAEDWVRAVQSIMESPAPSRPPVPRPESPGTEAASPDPTPIHLEYRAGSDTFKKEYALLVIACDPRALKGICDYSEDELAIFDQFINFTFHTTLVEVATPEKAQDSGVIFAPSPLDELDGSVYGYRNESAKQFGLETANKMTRNLVTVYQLLGPTPCPWSPAKFEEVLRSQLKISDWWPYGQDFEIRTSVTTPYFDHFESSSLRSGLPWTLLDRQGQRQTLIVHASMCFESVLHCWSYANLMLEVVDGARRALPKRCDAPIVILGAGVSGLLFAARLKGMGYTNVDILETTDRFGGKTHTIVEDRPCPPGTDLKTVCELGTCYLSPAYVPMVKDLQRFLGGNQQIDFTKGDKDFRSIVTAGEFSPGFNVKPIIPYAEYVVLKAEDLAGWEDSWLNQVLIKTGIAWDLAKYSLIHLEYMGFWLPMPPQAPEAFQQALGTQTFMEFLEAHDLLSLVSILQYGYEVQGYGPLKQISAYYGLVWVTPAITWTILMDSLGLQDEPVVTAWTKGWGDLWEQVVEKLSLNITYLAHTTSITRA